MLVYEEGTNIDFWVRQLHQELLDIFEEMPGRPPSELLASLNSPDRVQSRGYAIGLEQLLAVLRLLLNQERGAGHAQQ